MKNPILSTALIIAAGAVGVMLALSPDDEKGPASVEVTDSDATDPAVTTTTMAPALTGSAVQRAGEHDNSAAGADEDRPDRAELDAGQAGMGEEPGAVEVYGAGESYGIEPTPAMPAQDPLAEMPVPVHPEGDVSRSAPVGAASTADDAGGDTAAVVGRTTSSINRGPEQATSSPGVAVPRLQEIYGDGRPMRPNAAQEYFGSSGAPLEGAVEDALTYETGSSKLKESLDALKTE